MTSERVAARDNGEHVIEALGLRVSLVEGDDGYPIIYIDSADEAPKQTDNGVPMLRVHINDCCVLNYTPKKDGATGW